MVLDNLQPRDTDGNGVIDEDERAADSSRKIILDSDTDDVVVSVFSVGSAGGGFVWRFPEAGDYHWFNNQPTRLSTAEVESRLIAAAPDTGVLLVEVFLIITRYWPCPGWIHSCRTRSCCMPTRSCPVQRQNPINCRRRRNMRQKIFRKSERGQAIILIAAAAVGLIAMVGLMVDGGIMLIEYGRLKRAIDAASLSAALQYREGYSAQELRDASEEFLNLNQSDVLDIHVFTAPPPCTDPSVGGETDPSLSPPPGQPCRKLVRVTASRHVEFGFLPVIGIRGTDLTATSVGEAASVDVVLVLDSSASMAYEGGGDLKKPDDPADDPSACNPADTCEPFHTIKEVAVDFVEQLYFPYDRVSIITFDRNAHLILTLTGEDDAGNPIVDYETMTAGQIETAVVARLRGLNVFQPPLVCPRPVEGASPAPNCLNYCEDDDPEQFCIENPGTYKGLEFPLYRAGGNLDPSSMPSSNSGDGLWLAGAEFGREPIRQDSLWVVIVLTGGPANTGCTDGASHNCEGPTWADGRVCPPSNDAAPWVWVSPFCREGDVSEGTRHDAGDEDYDADDYARDAADFLANPLTGQGATIFSIGLGDLIRNNPSGDPLAGQKLLDYAATEAGDESGVPVNHGLYFFAPDPSDLVEIFRAIAENIATRISQ
jgi:hypothetical protein